MTLQLIPADPLLTENGRQKLYKGIWCIVLPASPEASYNPRWFYFQTDFLKFVVLRLILYTLGFQLE